MTGNDIVDITTATAESNWRRKGFLQKIFTPKEQLYIMQATLPDEMVWKLWSMKESAYKIYMRQTGERFFAPHKFSCTLVTQTTGRVDINDISYKTISSINKDFIYSIARSASSPNAPFINYCFLLPQNEYAEQQKFIYNKLIASYSSTSLLQKNKLIIIKDRNNIPFLSCKGKKIKIPVSITHHGRYAAFTIH